MNLTIALDEKQAGHLQKQASARRVSPEEFAGDLLKNALGRLAEEEAALVLIAKRAPPTTSRPPTRASSSIWHQE